MASYIVLQPAKAAADKLEEAVMVRDGFSLPALVMPLLWFLWHRMWLEALAFVLVGAVLGGLGALPSFSVVAPLLSLFLYILVGLEAQTLRVASLRRRGWNVWGVIEAANRDEAELRYAAEVDWPPAQGAVAAPGAPLSSPRSGVSRSPSGSFGLIDYPRKA
ncbi:DUF2628 domain-containing protein [Chelativorans sp.]|uniref:DUF2628 domain-containing protein n=1 Tax=Chelativorans sp. TaxID=2203393 RepID=UPI002811DA07|nr:DUF2628 domain-containing protein [Chelativorans sp.]